MGIYIFNTEVLLKALIADAEDPDSKHDFGHNILPNMLGKKKMMAYSFVDENKQQALYWRDVGTLDALLRRQYGPLRGFACLQPLRQELAHAHPCAPVSAGQVCLR